VTPSRRRVILSGNRPTGKLHLGNWAGALENWVALQDDYRCFFMVADWHVLTTAADATGSIEENTREMVIDWIAAGIDPERSIVFVQSRVKEHAELHLLFSMLVTKSRLERNPTVKEQARDLHISEQSMSYGHLGYPVLQAADILIYKGEAVPVGEDQVPHLELTREIARRFNSLYGPVFPEPESLLTSFARFPGLDGKRMSKSVGNTVLLADDEEEIWRKVRNGLTDPARKTRHDPGEPTKCTIFTYWNKFGPQDEIEEVAHLCRTAGFGCVDCKRRLAGHMNAVLGPIRERRRELAARPGDIDALIAAGTERARSVARATMTEVREVMKLG
jgi:tryptophanyl-tRNA synthetase